MKPSFPILFSATLLLASLGCAQDAKPATEAKPAAKADAKPRAEAKLDIDFKLDVGDPLYLVKPGDKTPIIVSAINRGTEAVSGQMQVQLESYDGSKIDFKQPVQLGAGADAKLQIPREKLGALGIKWLNTSLANADNVTLDQERLSFAYMNPVGPLKIEQQQMPIAIAYGANPDNDSELAAQAVARAGITMHRAPILLAGAQPALGHSVAHGGRSFQIRRQALLLDFGHARLGGARQKQTRKQQ